MHVHHINCGTMCPFGGRLMDGVSHGLRGRLVCHCLLIESAGGLILVDTGFGMNDIRKPFPRLSRFYASLLNIQLREEETAIAQVRRLGFKPEDVRHIVVTHLDFDHAGGIQDFPHAEIHVFAAERDAAMGRRSGFVGQRRYRPDQWGDIRRWNAYSPEGEPWFGFAAVRQMAGLPPDILLVPLIGHTWGHCGVAVRDDQGWLFHAGDAYFHHMEMAPQGYECPLGLRAYQRLMEVDRGQRLANQQRLRTLSRDHPDLRLFSAHDAVEFQSRAASGTH